MNNNSKIQLAAVCLGLTIWNSNAQNFLTLNLNGNSTLDNSANISGFPLGSQTYLGGVPFNQADLYGQVWNAALAAGAGSGAPVSLTLSMNVPDATGFYSLINTWWGQDASAGSFAAISFHFNDGSSFTKNLSGNVDIRDFNNPGSGWTTSVNGTTTQPVYQNTSGSSYYIDRQWYDFSTEGDAGKTLTSVTFEDTGAWSFQRYLVSGATVQSDVIGQVTAPLLTSGETGGQGTIPEVPEPSTIALIGGGSLALFAFRRRK